MSEQNTTISHQAEQSRFIIEVDGQEAGFASYAVTSDGVRNYDHTVIDPDFRGRGLSSPLIRFALDDARKEGLKIRQTCSAVEHFINKNEDYRDLVAE